jgi:hypothetical protein
MTPEAIQSIINAMPDGKRKRACIILADSEYHMPTFWRKIKAGEYGQAAALAVRGVENHVITDTLADMIWEGGA